MAVTYACSEITGMLPSGGPFDDTISGRYRSAYSRAGVQTNDLNYTTVAAPAAITNGWIKFHAWTSFFDSDGQDHWFSVFQDGGASPWLRMYIANNGSTGQFQYWNGTAWTGIGATFNITSIYSNAIHEWAFKIVCGTGGTATVFVDGIELATGSIGNATVNFRSARLMSGDSSAGAQVIYSEVVFSDGPISMLGTSVETEAPTSNGTDAVDGTGGFADIDEPVNSDVDALILSAAGQKRSFKSPARTGTLESVLAVTVAARANKGSSGPSKIKFYLLIGGVRYYSPDFALSLGYRGYQYSWATNPATGFAWTPTEVNDANLEWGTEAVA